MLQTFCWHATFQNCIDPILTDAETLLALIGMGLMPLRTGCFAFTPCIPAICVKASGILGVCHSATLSICCAGLRFWYNHRHVQTIACARAPVSKLTEWQKTAISLVTMGRKVGWLKGKHAEILGIVYSHLRKS